MKANVRDIGIEYETRGNGAPVAVLGGPWLGHQYLRAMEALADAHQVVWHDARGSGGTPLGAKPHASLQDLLADLDGLRAVLGFERWSLVAHSFGANLAVQYAARHPERVASLVLCNAGPPLAEDLMKAFFGEMVRRRAAEDAEEMRVLEASGAFARRDVKAVERSFVLTYLPFFDDRKAAETLELGFTSEGAKNAPGSEMRLFQEVAASDPIGALARIRCPTLVVHAERDPIPEAWSQLLVERIGQAELARIPSANHFAFLEKPGPFFAVVKPFLALHAKR